MYKLLLLYLTSVIWLNDLSAQTVKTVASLPNILRENSGIALSNNGKFLFINDGGNAPAVYRYDTATKSLETQNLPVSNVDWEDLTTDDQGYIYIGDVGNNLNNRRNLTIYKTKESELFSGNVIFCDTISFSYENQNEFPPLADKLNFDCEAMVWYRDSLYLFTKNRTKPYDGWCYMYVLPDVAGDYVARLADSVQFYSPSMELGWITSADIYGDSLVLLSSAQVHLAADFLSYSLSELSWQNVNVGFSQKESVCFGTDAQTIYISDEFNFIGNKLYKLLLGKVNVYQDFDIHSGLKYEMTPSELSIKLTKPLDAQLAVSDLFGREVMRGPFFGSIKLRGDKWVNQVYVVQIESDGFYQEFRWVKTE